MDCVCTNSLQSQFQATLPLIGIQIPIPPIAAQLALVAGAGPAVAASQSHFSAMMGLPPLPFGINMTNKIAATLVAAAQISAAFNVNLQLPTASARLNAIIASLNVNLSAVLPRLGIKLTAMLKLGPLLTLPMLLQAIVAFRANFGIDLLTPAGLLQLQAMLALAPPFPPPPPSSLSVSAMAQASLYAQLAAAASVSGGIPNFLPTLQAVANLQLNPIPPNLMFALSLMLALQQTSANLQLLGINPISATLNAQLRLILQPLLTLLASLTLPPSWWAFPGIAFTASIAANASAVAQLNLAAVAALRLPDLIPLSIVANLAANLLPPVQCSACSQ